MNRQQRRKAERELKKYKQESEKISLTIEEKDKMFKEGARYNSHEWAVRVRRVMDIPGIGPKRATQIFEALQPPLTSEEKKVARKMYESGEIEID